MNYNKINILNYLNAIAAQQHAQRKMSVKAVKEGIDKSDMPKEYKEAFKSYIDLGFALFEENDFEKAKIECTHFFSQIDKCQEQHNKRS